MRPYIITIFVVIAVAAAILLPGLGGDICAVRGSIAFVLNCQK